MYKTSQNLILAVISVLILSCQTSTQKELTVNPDHRFEISPCEFKYNGQTFSLDGDIQELIDIFGQYDRHIGYSSAYVWDSIGIGVLCHRQTKKTVEMTICFDCCEWVEPNENESALPFNCFKGAIFVDGVLFGNGKSMEDFKIQLNQKDSQIEFSYWKLMKDYNYTYDCGYDETPSNRISYMNHTLIIRPNTPTTYSFFTISDSREHHRLEGETKKSHQGE